MRMMLGTGDASAFPFRKTYRVCSRPGASLARVDWLPESALQGASTALPEEDACTPSVGPETFGMETGVGKVTPAMMFPNSSTARGSPVVESSSVMLSGLRRGD